MKLIIPLILVAAYILPATSMIIPEHLLASHTHLKILKNLITKKQYMQCLVLKNSDLPLDEACKDNPELSPEEERYSLLIGKIVQDVVYVKKTCVHVGEVIIYRSCERLVKRDFIHFFHIKITKNKKKGIFKKVVTSFMHYLQYLEEKRTLLAVKPLNEPTSEDIGQLVQDKIKEVIDNRNTTQPINITINIYTGSKNTTSLGKPAATMHETPIKGLGDELDAISDAAAMRYQNNVNRRNRPVNKSGFPFNSSGVFYMRSKPLPDRNKVIFDTDIASVEPVEENKSPSVSYSKKSKSLLTKLIRKNHTNLSKQLHKRKIVEASSTMDETANLTTKDTAGNTEPTLEIKSAHFLPSKLLIKQATIDHDKTVHSSKHNLKPTEEKNSDLDNISMLSHVTNTNVKTHNTKHSLNMPILSKHKFNNITSPKIEILPSAQVLGIIKNNDIDKTEKDEDEDEDESKVKEVRKSKDEDKKDAEEIKKEVEKMKKNIELSKAKQTESKSEIEKDTNSETTSLKDKNKNDDRSSGQNQQRAADNDNTIDNSKGKEGKEQVANTVVLSGSNADKIPSSSSTNTKEDSAQTTENAKSEANKMDNKDTNNDKNQDKEQNLNAASEKGSGISIISITTCLFVIFMQIVW